MQRSKHKPVSCAGMPAPEQFLREDAAVPSATRAEEPQPRGLQRSAATEGPGQAAGGSKLPSVLQVESSGGDAKSLQRPAAADVRKRRRRARFVFPEDSEAYVAAEEAGCVQQPSGSDDIWLCSDDGNDEGEEVAPEEGACCRPSATALVARQSINGLGSNAANAAASPAGVLIKEEPTGEPCSQAAAQGGLCSLSDVVERWSEAYPSELKEVHAKRQEQRDAVAAFDQALRSNSRSANLASTIANGDAPPKAAEGVSDVDRAAAAAAASVVGALRRKQACRQPVIKAEAMDVSREINDGRFVATPARSTAVIMEESPAGVPNRAAEGPPEQAPSRVPNRAAAGRPDQAAAKAPEQAGSSSRAAAAPLAGTSGLGAKPLHRKLTARKITAGARPPAPPHRAAVPAACASLQQLHVEVIAALSEEDTDEYVHGLLRLCGSGRLMCRLCWALCAAPLFRIYGSVLLFALRTAEECTSESSHVSHVSRGRHGARGTKPNTCPWAPRSCSHACCNIRSGKGCMPTVSSYPTGLHCSGQHFLCVGA